MQTISVCWCCPLANGSNSNLNVGVLKCNEYMLNTLRSLGEEGCLMLFQMALTNTDAVSAWDARFTGEITDVFKQ